MLKRLLKNYPQVAQLETKGFEPKSKLDDELKYKLVKSWVKGGSRVFFCQMNGITEEEYRTVTKDLVNEARCTGDDIVISVKQRVSEGVLWLFGLIADRYNPTAALTMLDLSRSSKKKYIDEYEVITGEKVEIRSRLRDRKYFTKISDEFISRSPKTDRRLNKLGDATYYSEEIRLLEMKAINVTAVLYCMDSMREYMWYEGDDKNPRGTYEFHFEYLTDVEKKDEAVA